MPLLANSNSSSSHHSSVIHSFSQSDSNNWRKHFHWLYHLKHSIRNSSGRYFMSFKPLSKSKKLMLDLDV